MRLIATLLAKIVADRSQNLKTFAFEEYLSIAEYHNQLAVL